MAFTTYGAFAEEVKTEASRLLPLPEKMDFVDRRRISPDLRHHRPRVARPRGAAPPARRCSCSAPPAGSGLAAIEIGKALGARVIACASSEDKLAVCRSTARTRRSTMRAEDLRERIKALTEGRGVDVVYDPVGGPYTEPAFRSLAWRGRHLVVGFAAGEIPKLPLNLALLKGAAVVGVFWGDFARREPKVFAAERAPACALVRGRQAEAARVGNAAAGKGGRGAEDDGGAASKGETGSYGRLASP